MTSDSLGDRREGQFVCEIEWHACARWQSQDVRRDGTNERCGGLTYGIRQNEKRDAPRSSRMTEWRPSGAAMAARRCTRVWVSTILALTVTATAVNRRTCVSQAQIWCLQAQLRPRDGELALRKHQFSAYRHNNGRAAAHLRFECTILMLTGTATPARQRVPPASAFHSYVSMHGSRGRSAGGSRIFCTAPRRPRAVKNRRTCASPARPRLCRRTAARECCRD